jgi:hypothetical protein
MKKYALAACLALPLLAGCQPVTAINNTLATLAKNDIPTACAIVDKAESYFAMIVGTPTAAVATAEAEGKAICANPPTDIASAFATLLQVWTVVQAATVTPKPTPTPTPN